MLQNNLDPDVAERPDDLVVYGGTGRAARDWASFDAHGPHADDAGGRRDAARPVRPAGRGAAHARVGAAGADRQLEPGRRLGDLAGVPPAGAARPDDVRPDDRRARGSTSAPRASCRAPTRRSPRSPPSGSAAPCAGTLTVTGGCGGMGGAQPLAVTLNGGVCLVVDVDRSRGCGAGSSTATSTSWPPTWTTAVQRCLRGEGGGRGACRSGWSATAPSVLPELLRRGVEVDVVTDQTSAHDPLAYLPDGVDARGLGRLRGRQARRVHRPGAGVDGPPRRGDGRVPRRAAPRCSTTATRSATRPATAATTAPSPSPASCPPTSGRCSAQGKGPFRWAALSGDPADIAATDEAVLELFPDNDKLQRWIRAARETDRVPGAAGADLLARARRAGQGRAAVQRAGRRRAAVRADRDRPRPPRRRVGRLAVPGDRGDGRRLGRDRRLAAAQRAGQHRVRARRGCRSTTAAGSASAGRSTPGRSAWPTARALAAEKLARVLTNDPAMGVLRHVDAGYPEAADAARAGGLRIPMDEAGKLLTRARGLRRCSRRDPRQPQGARCRQSRRPPSTGCWADLAPARAASAHRRLPALRLDPRGRRPARVVHRRGRARAGSTSSTTGRATSGPGGAIGRRGTGPGVVTGSHLDSVPDGGAFDGPLGVVSRARRGRRAAARRVRPGPAARRRAVRRGGGRAVRRRLRWARGCSPGR